MSPSEARAVLDTLEADIDRMRDLDAALKASMLARYDALRAYVKASPAKP